MAYAHILVATGGSEHARKAEAEAVRLAAALGCRLTLLAVVPLSTTAPEAAYPTYQAQLEHLTQVLEEAEARCREAGMSVRTRLESGAVGPVIVRVAEEEGCDLIVLGRRKLSLVAAAVLGSVSDYVVRHAARSTLIAQPGNQPGSDAA
jgi:nucleotide-binding universal stress UspA family protein